MIKHREDCGSMDLSWARAMILVDPPSPLGERRGSSKRHFGAAALFIVAPRERASFH